jgi:hypothetical protein
MGVGLIPDRAFEVVGAGMSLHAIPLRDEWARQEPKIANSISCAQNNARRQAPTGGLVASVAPC